MREDKSNGRRMVIGDIHGQYEALQQVLERSNFNSDDKLYGLGDYVDGGPQTKEVIEYLMGLDNFYGIEGNHDCMVIETFRDKICRPIHLQQGGKATLKSYDYMIPEKDAKYLESLPFYIELDEGTKLLVHGGLPCANHRKDFRYLTKEDIWLDEVCKKASEFDSMDLMWDRTLFKVASLFGDKNITSYEEIFIGHTTTQMVGEGDTLPLNLGNVWMMDTGGGYDGKLTVMDIDTKEYWQSDVVESSRG